MHIILAHGALKRLTYNNSSSHAISGRSVLIPFQTGNSKHRKWRKCHTGNGNKVNMLTKLNAATSDCETMESRQDQDRAVNFVPVFEVELAA